MTQDPALLYSVNVFCTILRIKYNFSYVEIIGDNRYIKISSRRYLLGVGLSSKVSLGFLKRQFINSKFIYGGDSTFTLTDSGINHQRNVHAEGI